MKYLYHIRLCLKALPINKHETQSLCFSRLLLEKRTLVSKSKFFSSAVKYIDKPDIERSLKDIANKIHNLDTITTADVAHVKHNESGILDPYEEDVSEISSFISPSFNLAAYVNKSHSLQQLVKLGVDLYKVELKKDAAQFILNLDFEKHMKLHLRFLHDIGLPAEEFGKFITKNPFIFKQQLDDLQVRVNYLEAKKFTTDAITRIVTANPVWLNFSTIEIDKRLGFFQRTFILSGDEVRQLVVLRPRIITYDLGRITVSLYAVKGDMGFNEEEAKALLLKKPKLYDISTKALKERFDYVHNIMEISHEQILQQPSVLLFRNFIVKQRHEFLKTLGKAQYDPKTPGYISLDTLIQGSDVDFCTNVAKISIDVFNAYLKTC
ncbi:LOW QUALITY PROTEIN: transcription termination factor 3, mitochondrial-like [Homalodisca vitripennis]|uniref:LOW QUALITY PROTEIN: transcription termination factor 3, mitochondrial-like n=1 Tax=Homalodisca vitripennis TaxID=197043 RepID=UPI001EECE96D|nr:LOW QUALITY PROTEIN: transcription termination factor 3, mitochondrial-like [Homalodisca vitripennis]